MLSLVTCHHMLCKLSSVLYVHSLMKVTAELPILQKPLASVFKIYSDLLTCRHWQNVCPFCTSCVL